MRVLSWWMLLATLVVAQAPDPPPPPPPDPAMVQNAQGVALYEKGDFAGAISRFEEARRLRPGEKVFATNLASALYGRGMKRAEGEGLDAALRDLKRAVGLDPDEHLFTLGLGSVYLRLGENDNARAVLEKALRAWPGKAGCHEAMGRLEYSEEHLKEAILYLETASKLDPERGKRLKPLLDKIRREAEVEKRFFVERRGPFTVKYDDEKFRDVSQSVLDILDTNYNALAQDLGHWPKRPVSVVLYTRGNFDLATGALGWTGGLFDGKIRLPVKNFRQAKASIEATLAHELSHFFVREMTRHCPLWLDEGLAQLRQGREASSVAASLRGRRQAGTLVSPSALPASWTKVKDTETVRLYYAVSLSFTAYLQRQYGMASIVDLLEKLDGKRPFKEIFEKSFSRGLDEVQEDWKLSL